jgi:cytochrome P450
MATAAPPGPKISLLGSLIYRPGRDPLAFFSNLARQYGDLVSYRMGGEQIFFVNDPRLIRDILVTHDKNFTKSRGLERTKRLLGNGLLTSEGAFHLRQRRLMQPAFHRERVAAYARTMAEYADRLRAGWTDGATLDISQEMTRVTLSIAGKTLFDLDVESRAADVGAALTDVMESFWISMMPFADVLERLPVGPLRKAKAARNRLDAIIYRMIAERRASGIDRGDLLSMLLLAHDEDDPSAALPTEVARGDSTGRGAMSGRGPSVREPNGGAGMTDLQVRDEAMTIFLAGHETTANALTWTWYLVSQSPDVEAQLHEEIDRVLQGRLPSVSDIPSLPVVERIVAESMRLYPPAWIVGRRAIGEYAIGGYVAPPRSIFVMSQWVTHRDARFFPDPDRFNPDRWTPDFRTSLPKFAYFPFGGGPRQCIGESFAWMEAILLVATIAQQWRLRLVAGHPVVPQPLVTLRTKHGMRMIVSKR